MTSMCAPQILKTIVSNKEFRIIPTPLFQHVQTHTELSVESKFLWVVLWELCSPSPTYEKTLTWGFLSKRLNKSESTIRRWAKPLIKFGYLAIESIFSGDGSQLPSKFRIGVPQAIAKRIWTVTPNRFKANTNKNDRKEDKPAGVVIDVSENEALEDEKLGQELDSDNDGAKNEKQEEVIPERSEAENAGVDQESNEQAGVDAGVDESIQNSAGSCAESCEGSPEPAVADAGSKEPVQISGGGSNVSRMLSTLNKHLDRVRKGSNSAQSARSEGKSLDVQGQQKKRSERKSSEAQIQPKTGLKRVGEGAIKSVFEGAIKSGTQEKNQQNQDNSNSVQLRSTIKADLMVRLGTGYDYKTLTEEVAISIEKGSFQKFSYKKAINIAAKLIRENRWMKPRVAVVYA
ncbi:Uncharacterised protein [Ectopseudomonas mendocina]|uniref:Helix-turn-helix domain-containing protein n=1 Tax=Ectopseudomonas mendocina TaxID=300 RepID=A0A379PM36_ECTME|nr:hypothetical protein [Pseudomonas mendocina]SUE95837.1 Uncharacterised protein [Pseudomonas mendocina]